MQKFGSANKFSGNRMLGNEPHPRSQVKQSSEALGILINLIKECFPRDEGWGWDLPIMHAFAKRHTTCRSLDQQIFFQVT
jgi:hypothetical protein